MLRLAALIATLGLGAFGIAGCGGGGQAGAGGTQTGGPAVSYGQVQAVFDKYGCAGCHPGVDPSLDLRTGHSYDSLVGVKALEDPTLYRVVAGDPGKSFLYLKLGGDAPVADIPAIGSRMPPAAPPIDPGDLKLVEDWILQGAKNVDGKTEGPTVPSPGSPPTGLDVAAAASPQGTGTITGTVIDQQRRPIAGALVTLLLKGPDQPGGVEHYRVAVTGPDGKYTLGDAPSGQFLLKAYAPDTIYIARIVALKDGETQTVDFGLPDRVVDNPRISSPKVEETAGGTTLSLDVTGSNLAPNYILAVNPGSGLVFELHGPGDQPGRWSARIDKKLRSPWIFLAVDNGCNTSEFLTVGG